MVNSQVVKRFAKVYFYTFRDGQTQGLSVPIGIRNVEVVESNQQLCHHSLCGCCELQVHKVTTVCIAGRIFVLSKYHSFTEKESEYSAEFQTAIPQELAKTIRNFCPNCGQHIE